MTEVEKPIILKSTRHATAAIGQFNPKVPRLGRRESEPHSEEITYLYDVLTTNFPESRTTWDLHHYFRLSGKKIDIQYDLSFFYKWSYEKALPSYNAEDFDNRIPDMAVNFLSKSTYMNDLTNIKEYSERLGVKFYIVFAPYNIPSSAYSPPFLRIYRLDPEEGKYTEITINKIAMVEGKPGIDESQIVDLAPELPFKVGIMERLRRYSDDSKLYRMVLFDGKTGKRLPTKAEMEKERADREKERADREKERADREKERADRLEKLLEEYKKKLAEFKDKV